MDEHSTDKKWMDGWMRENMGEELTNARGYEESV
jgi:hypothetical protein